MNPRTDAFPLTGEGSVNRIPVLFLDDFGRGGALGGSAEVFEWFARPCNRVRRGFGHQIGFLCMIASPYPLVGGFSVKRIALLLLAAAFLVASLSGCGESTSGTDAASESEPSVSAQPAEKSKPKPPTVEECLEKPGALEDPEQRDPTFWRATFIGSALLARVEKFDSKKEAKSAVRDATDVSAAQGGVYAVFGPIKGATPTPGDSKNLVPDIIDAVADCLKETK